MTTFSAPPGQRQYLLESELASRWGISRRSLQRWRQLQRGPAYLRLGGRIAYAIDDVVAFELDCRVQIVSPRKSDSGGADER